jgi:hypothetical protein
MRALTYAVALRRKGIHAHARGIARIWQRFGRPDGVPFIVLLALRGTDMLCARSSLFSGLHRTSNNEPAS